MSDSDADFQSLLKGVRAGEAAAATELVRRYEPEIRRAIRVRLTDARLRRVLDSMDVGQSVFANFFVRASLGEFDLHRPADLVALLVSMVRNKVVDQTRRLNAHKRDQRRVEPLGDTALTRLPQNSAGPDRRVADRDLLDEVRRRLSDDERRLADLRAAGREWDEIAAETGAKPDALRKKLSRALDRVAAELGLEDLANDR
ncbi:MAG TPA: sigma-70 family RNA polymerase sigma factor [Pirellulaceae bacterium]|nr:sigma-70 family RNA polymerase sigma factor [Pirellulaceae bacterium]